MKTMTPSFVRGLLIAVSATPVLSAQVEFAQTKTIDLPAAHAAAPTLCSVGDLDGDSSPDIAAASGYELGAHLGFGRYSGFENASQRSATVDDLAILENPQAGGRSSLFTCAGRELVQWTVIEATVNPGQNPLHQLELGQVDTLSTNAVTIDSWAGPGTFGFIAINEGGTHARLMARNTADGSFFAQVTTMTMPVSQVCLADLDGDGGPELLTFGSSFLVIYSTAGAVLHIEVGDFSNAVPFRVPNKFGLSESVLWYANNPGETRLYTYSLQSGMVSQVFAPGAIRTAAMGDFDDDQSYEFVAITADDGTHVVEVDRGGRTVMQVSPPFNGGIKADSLVTGDFDGDGDEDLVAALDDDGVTRMALYESKRYDAARRRSTAEAGAFRLVGTQQPSGGGRAAAPWFEDVESEWQFYVDAPDDLDEMAVNAVELRMWRGADPAALPDALEKMYVETEYHVAIQQLDAGVTWPSEGLVVPSDEVGIPFGTGVGPTGWGLPLTAPSDRIYYLEVRLIHGYGTDEATAYPSTFYALTVEAPGSRSTPENIWLDFVAFHEPEGHIGPPQILPSSGETPVVRTRKVKNVDPVICGISLPQ